MREIESEKTLERLLKRLVESEMHGLCVKLLSDFVTGLPDRMCLLPGGLVFFIELKTTGKRPSKIQFSVHEKLRSLGFRVYVVDSTDTLMKVLDLESNRCQEQKLLE